MTTGDDPRPAQAAAFFDVDGTIVRSTIVHYYIYFRRRRMSPLLGAAWNAAYLFRCVYYLLLDKRDRGRMNVVFYRGYRGMREAEVRSLVDSCHRDVIAPRCFPDARRCIADHQNAGRRVVLVTGSIGFILAPLAESLQTQDLLTPTLVARDGVFTGELDGPPMGGEHKARCIRAFAAERGVDLRQSHAYGDSIADLPMLEAVGFPHAVNPDRALAAMARARGWPVHRWSVGVMSKDGAA